MLWMQPHKHRCVALDTLCAHRAANSTSPPPQLAGDDAYVENARTWWRWTDSEPGTRPSRALHYTGWDESVQHLTQALEQHAPVHVIMGFSQGSTAASLLVSQLVAQNSVLLEPLQAAVLVRVVLQRAHGVVGHAHTHVLVMPATNCSLSVYLHHISIRH